MCTFDRCIIAILGALHSDNGFSEDQMAQGSKEGADK